MTIAWPDQVLRPQSQAEFDIAPRTLAGPSSVSGFTQVVSSDAGIWKATLPNIPMRGRDEVLAFRAIAALLEGRLGTIMVPRCRGYGPSPEGADYSDIPHSDETLFYDDVGYAGGAISVSVVTAAAARAVSIDVEIVSAGEIEAGQDFSIGERMYRVRSVVYDDDTHATITFRPPLREAVAAGAELNFDAPACRMRLASDDEMSGAAKGSVISVRFIEDV